MYPIEYKIRDTTDTARSALYLDLHVGINCEERLKTKHYNKTDYFQFSTLALELPRKSVKHTRVVCYVTRTDT